MILTSFIESFWKKIKLKKKKKIIKNPKREKKSNIDDVDGFVIQGKITLKLSPYTIFFSFLLFAISRYAMNTHTHTKKKRLKKM